MDTNALSVENTSRSIPEESHLYQNYPNPFNALTYIQKEVSNIHSKISLALKVLFFKWLNA